MDNIRMRKNENKLIIKKGWIAQKFIILYFIILASVLLLYLNSSLPSDEFKRKYPYVIFFIRFSLVSIYWMHINKDIKRNFIFEGIFINFEEIKTINIYDIKNIDAEKNPEGKYSLEFIVNGDSSKYLWGFALSESKAHEIKEKLLKTFRGEASYEIS